MSTEIIAALIALIGVVFSITGSFLTSLWQTKKEITKIHQEVQLKYADGLITKRLELYPKIYSLLT